MVQDTTRTADFVPWWRIGFSGQGWRQLIYALFALPLNILALLLGIAGKGRLGFDCQLTVARDLLHAPLLDHGPVGSVRAFIYSLVTIPLNLVTFILSAYLSSLLLLSIFYILRPILRGETLSHIFANNYYHAWGGPTLSGAWGVHAALALIVLLGPVMWLVAFLTWLQGRLLQRLHPISL